MDEVFRALADPSRRLLLDRLSERDGQTVGELHGHLAEQMTRFGVMKHLAVLEGAGLVTTQRVGREKRHYLNPVPIQQVYDRWVSRFAAPLASALGRLKLTLEDPSVSTSPQHVYQVLIRATPDAVWQAIVDPEMTSRYYYGTAFRSSLEPGAALTYLYPDGSVAADGEILEVDRPHRLAMRFHARWDPAIEADGPVRMTWEVEPQGSLCRLTVRVDDLVAGSKAEQDFVGGLAYIISGLKTLLETGEPLAVG